MRVDSSLLTEMVGVIEGMNRNESLNIFKAYFQKKAEIILEDLIERAGDLNQTELIHANAQLDVYRKLIEFEKTINSELKLT